MSQALSENTKAVLLLTAPLITGSRSEPAEVLTPAEYRKFLACLRDSGAEPAHLLAPGGAKLLDTCARIAEQERVERLLARGLALSQAVERWQTRAMWVLSHADDGYPTRFRSRLGDDAPAVLYGCGDRTILESGGIAVVGSRRVDNALLEYSRGVGALAASSGRTLVSGGARGIDQAAMSGALERGGRAAGVLADSLEGSAMNRANRQALVDAQLVLVSPYDPRAGFNVGNAMQRNKLVYALADAALVVNADANKGGTWAGACEQLEKLHFVPIYVRSSSTANAGLDGLRQKGALDWPDPDDADGLAKALAAPAKRRQSPPVQGQLFSEPIPAEAGARLREAATPWDSASSSEEPFDAAGELFEAVREVVVRLLRSPMKPADVATKLDVTPSQAKQWLERLAGDGVLTKGGRPLRYWLAGSKGNAKGG